MLEPRHLSGADIVKLAKLCRISIRLVFSVAFAGIFYTGWLAVAISLFKSDMLGNPAIKAIFLLTAAPITAAGFATGIMALELLSRSRTTKFLDIFKWSLIACAVAAAVVYPFGPMLIVFGIFAAGTATIMAVELHDAAGRNKNDSAPMPERQA